MYELGNTKMKNILIGIVLLMSAPSSAQSIGIFLGTPMSGIQLKYEALRFSLGIDDVGIAVDKTFDLGALLNKSDFESFYTYLGAQFIDHKNDKVGIRSGVGFLMPVNQVSIYGEVGPTLYVAEDVNLNIEAALGFRVSF